MTAHMIADQCWEESQEDLAEVLATPVVEFEILTVPSLKECVRSKEPLGENCGADGCYSL